MIKVENLTKYFGNTKAVDDVSFEIGRGEILGFLGPNGAGKTTTMRIIAGFFAPDKGKVTIDGVLVDQENNEIQKKIGYLPENNPLYKEMLVSEFLDLAAELSHVPKQEKAEALDFVVSAVGIKNVFYKPIAELSKGYKQRVGIAAALIHRPDIIIMDEPTEGLDPNQRAEIRSLIKKLSQEHTIIISTHVMQEASAVCDRLLIINKGKIVADGTAADLSRKAEQRNIISIDVEGKNVNSLIMQIQGVEKMEEVQNKNGRFSARIIASGEEKIQPEISRLARDNQWVIWKISEEEFGLEDIFRKLTE